MDENLDPPADSGADPGADPGTDPGTDPNVPDATSGGVPPVHTDYQGYIGAAGKAAGQILTGVGSIVNSPGGQTPPVQRQGTAPDNGAYGTDLSGAQNAPGRTYQNVPPSVAGTAGGTKAVGPSASLGGPAKPSNLKWYLLGGGVLLAAVLTAALAMRPAAVAPAPPTQPRGR